MAGSNYRLANGTAVPRVTTILSKRRDPGGLIHWAYQCGVDGVDYRKKRDDAADSGTLAHRMIEEALADSDPYALQAYVNAAPEIRARAAVGYEAYRQWRQDARVEILDTEIEMVSEEHRFGGTADAIGIRAGELAILDWKTSNAIYSDHLIQLAAYRQLARENQRAVDTGYILRFDKEWASFTDHHIPSRVLDLAWEAFMHLRKLYDLDATLRRAA